ncbi:MAG: hypothetical protein AAF438_03950 [Pseudomonadota bacterium]
MVNRRRTFSVCQKGNTLFEFILVVAIIGLVGSMAIPSFGRVDHANLSHAANRVADAVRYARETARQTRTMHGVEVDFSTNRVRVFRLLETSDPNTKVFDVYDPVTKQLINIPFSQAPFREVKLTGLSASNIGSCSDSISFVFDESGMVRCFEPVSSRIEAAQIILAHENQVAEILIDPYTGRVTQR